jgi:hypothetical protein
VLRSRQPPASAEVPQFEVAVTMERYQFVRAGEFEPTGVSA